MTAILYGAKGGGSASNLYTLDPTTGTESSVGPTGYAITGLAFHPFSGVLYGATSTASPTDPSSLVTIDTGTGAGTLVGAFGFTIPDIAFDGAGVLYGWDGSSHQLATINLSTGTATPFGAVAGATIGAGISADSGDAFYTSITVGTLYTVDQVTGVAAFLASLLGLPAPSATATIAALAFDGSDLLWGIARHSSSAWLFTTLFDGTATTIGATGANMDALAWSADVVPAPVGRVLIGLDDTALEENPAWTRIDDTPNLVSGIDIRRGRQSEEAKTETSTATVYLNDTSGDFDPNNTLSPYFGRLDGKQILLQVRNPVTDVWEPQTRMTIDEVTHDFNPGINRNGEPLIANVALECVCLFDYVAGVEMIPGLFGDAPPAGSERTVFYEDTTGGDGMQTRLVQLAADAGVPAGRTRFFTGNVDLQETKYDPGESVLVAMRDAVDAEFPDIANMFTDRRGILAAHGRFARFTPEAVQSGTDWVFTRWKAGDGTAILADSDRAQIRPPLGWTRPRSRVVNAAMCTQKGIVDADVPGQIVIDTTSKNALGYHSWSALDLIVKAGATTGFTAKGECKSFSRFKVDNYKDEHTRVEAITFKSIRPDDPRGPKTWALLLAVDISDVIELSHGYPGGVGFTDEAFFVEGMETQIRPLNPDYDWVEKTVNVSPASHYPPDYVFSDA